MQRVHLVIAGEVQGVGFRRAAQREAHRRGLGGWVRNLWDGRVECLAEGPKPALESFIAWCHEGPRFAHVHAVEVNWEEGEGSFPDFSIR